MTVTSDGKEGKSGLLLANIFMGIISGTLLATLELPRMNTQAYIYTLRSNQLIGPYIHVMFYACLFSGSLICNTRMNIQCTLSGLD